MTRVAEFVDDGDEFLLGGVACLVGNLGRSCCLLVLLGAEAFGLTRRRVEQDHQRIEHAG
ncbi:hypothetical protein [Micromonospora phaseoli]|uniref:hypothetical protein n=1 Tax=Micromonospora phaseoli TaxID=1144548 RepID=UPI0011141304|nr:hypothetical protein [Micromonospora phaseoli]